MNKNIAFFLNPERKSLLIQFLSNTLDSVDNILGCKKNNGVFHSRKA